MNKIKLEKTDLLKEKERLEKENRKLKKTIDKTIEYIEENCYDGKEYDIHGDMLNVRELLDVLKGSDKE